MGTHKIHGFIICTTSNTVQCNSTVLVPLCIDDVPVCYKSYVWYMQINVFVAFCVALNWFQPRTPNCIKGFLDLPGDSSQSCLTLQLIPMMILVNGNHCNVKPDWPDLPYQPMKMLYTIVCWRACGTACPAKAVLL